ncbi:hypothetical protein BGX33_002162 [Mortierella sp. NVP41]|nr:hypothetical protein BGX33_002162 [Mortierella sp. NVP41]
MDALELHPRFNDVRDECHLFPDHAEQLFQVYLDLTQAKDFEDVSVIQAPLLGRCLIDCKHPDTGVQYLILPVFVAEPWTAAKMESTFSALSNENDARLNASRRCVYPHCHLASYLNVILIDGSGSVY